MPEFITNGVKLTYDDEGSGKPLILLHGLGGNRYSYLEFIEEFKQKNRVIALDSRGHGDSEKPPNYTLNDHINDVIAVMDYLGLESADILGASMGSYIAQGVAITIPSRIKKLILVVAKSQGKTSSTQELMEKHAKEIEGLDLEEAMAHLSKYIFYNVDLAWKYLTGYQMKGKALTPEEQARANKALEGFDFRRDLHKITANTLLISGRYDGLNPPELGREIADLIPHSTFVEFEKSGHAPNAEEPERFRKVVQNFLQE
ncbi:alpha/beta hydrolase [Bacillus sp. FJAT-49736]|uniref:alpha/beta fold hydrolase n=1 Tax=Bacillus sp. FJAT-49736 TaxID=2833582 RepID=UPI001BC996E9|nr:alpha/beta hydrolase [Bacillus sp. FJAT-49736]MBS4174431.1 alpha/beta hydrolase [Bacillus sp. FJAT-49736]